MAIPVLVYGKSGSGKSRSLKEFEEDEIVLFNVISKDMPFKKRFKYEVFTDNYGAIKKALTEMPTDVAVIDDAGYLQTNTFMRGHSSPKSGGSTFDLFNKIGDECWELIMFIKRELPKNKRVYLLMHELSNDYGEVKVRTIGKLLDEKVLSAVIEFGIHEKELEDVIHIVERASRELDTVVSVGLAAKARNEAFDYIFDRLEKDHIFFRKNGKLNVGLGRPLKL